jgi:hypothetical protein
MANLLPFLRMDALQAARFREETAGDSDRLEPRQGGTPATAAFWYLPERVINDPAFAARRAVLRMLPVIAIDTEVVFPPGPETRTLQEKALNGLAAG